jgi:intergrase/recombinase
MSYANRYSHLIYSENLREIDLLSNDNKTHVIKSLILISKFNGTYKQFKDKMSTYGIKMFRASGLDAFLRIMNAGNNHTLEWYNLARSKLRENEALFTKFLLYSGLRTSEAIASFNLVIKLHSEGKLNEYYSNEYNCLMHFKYPKQFIRRTKACYLTFIKPEFLSEIANSQPVTYAMLRKRLEKQHLKLRFNEFRDKFGTHLVSHGILEMEQNLCCGRIPTDIFIRHYWSPKLKELADRIFTALDTLTTQ